MAKLILFQGNLQKERKNVHQISIFLQNIWLSQRKAVLLQHENPPSLFTMLKSAGRFILWHIRYNIRLSQEMYAVVCCFEVTLRNRIDQQLKSTLGNDWLRDLVLPGGAFYSDPRVDKTRKIIDNAYRELVRKHSYTHSQLLSKMEFGV